MKHLKKNLLIFTLIIILVLSSGLATSQDAGSIEPEPGIGMITYHELMLFQGDDPTTAEIEPANSVVADDKIRWLIPWNSTYVYVSVPQDAEDVVIHNVVHDGVSFVHGPYNLLDHDTSQYYLETEGDHSGFYKWEMPADANLEHSFNLIYNTTEGFSDIDEAGTDIQSLEIGNDSISLKPGIEEANYTYNMKTMGYDIISVNASINGGADIENITLQFTVDDGSTWADMNSSDAKEFTGVNNEMRFRILMTQDPMLNNTPVIENISFDIMYIPQNIEVWLETSYHMDIPDKGLDFTIHLVYDQPSMPIYYVGYFDDSTHIAYAGFQATSTTFDSMPDKVVHMTMGEDHESILGFHITFEESGMAFSTSLFIVLLFIIITMGAVGFYFKGRPKDSEAAKTDTVEDDEGDDDAPVKVKGKTVTTMQTGSIEKGPDTPLIKRRLVLVEMISRLEREVDGGLMNPDSAARMKASYQKELDEIDDKLADTPSPELEELASKKAQMIDKLKTLDEQLEKGEITSEDHEILQTNYKKKAIDIMKQMDEIS